MFYEALKQLQVNFPEMHAIFSIFFMHHLFVRFRDLCAFIFQKSILTDILTKECIKNSLSTYDLAWFCNNSLIFLYTYCLSSKSCKKWGKNAGFLSLVTFIYLLLSFITKFQKLLTFYCKKKIIKLKICPFRKAVEIQTFWKYL